MLDGENFRSIALVCTNNLGGEHAQHKPADREVAAVPHVLAGVNGWMIVLVAQKAIQPPGMIR